MSKISISFDSIVPTEAPRIFVRGEFMSIAMQGNPMDYIAKRLQSLIGKPLASVTDNIPVYEQDGKRQENLVITYAIAVRTKIHRVDQSDRFDIMYDLHCYYGS